MDHAVGAALPAWWSPVAPSRDSVAAPAAAAAGAGAAPLGLRPRLLPTLCLLLLLLLPATHAAVSRFDPPIPETIEYGSLGNVTTTKDWYHRRFRVFNPTPRSREDINTAIRLFTRRTGDKGVPVWPLQQSASAERTRPRRAGVRKSAAARRKPEKARAPAATPQSLSRQLDCSLPVRLVVHGWRGAASHWMKEMAREFLKREPCSVLVVLWDGEVNYFQATQDIRVVALEVAALLRHLTATCGLRASQLHLVGHSLGAHACGYVGNLLPGVRRITGLDPAEPSYEFMPAFVRLDPTDADFVDVIHTDSQSILGSGLGMRQPAGHVDFFPNAGSYQPGCELWQLPADALSKGVLSAAADLSICSHSRAPALFTESINSHCRFVAFRCASYMQMHSGECATCGEKMERCAVMGMDADKFRPPHSVVNASFFLTTARDPPFCQRPYLVTLFPAEASGDSYWGHLSVQLRGTSGAVSHVALTENDDLTGPLPYVGIRLPNPLRVVANRTGPREVAWGRPLRLLGWSRNDTGARVSAAALRWDWLERAPLRRLLPCLFRCKRPLPVQRLSVRTFPLPARETDNELCPGNGQDVVEIESGSSATLRQECAGQPRQRAKARQRPQQLAAWREAARLPRPRGRLRMRLRPGAGVRARLMAPLPLPPPPPQPPAPLLSLPRPLPPARF